MTQTHSWHSETPMSILFITNRIHTASCHIIKHQCSLKADGHIAWQLHIKPLHLLNFKEHANFQHVLFKQISIKTSLKRFWQTIFLTFFIVLPFLFIWFFLFVRFFVTIIFAPASPFYAFMLIAWSKPEFDSTPLPPPLQISFHFV